MSEHVHDHGGLLPHAFEPCCVGAYGRLICRCGFSERNRVAHPVEQRA